MGDTHYLKTWPVYFTAAQDGSKTFEVRKNDRDYKVGDTLVLYKWDPNYDAPTTHAACFTISYVLHANQSFGALNDGYVALGILPREPQQMLFDPNALKEVRDG